MKKTSKEKKPLSAEGIARLADKGGDISSFFTNKGKMMPPVRPTVKIDELASDFTSITRTLHRYQKSTRQLMERVHRRDLVYEFFFVFSRFEHSLAMTNYLTETKGGVSADWDKFAREINESFFGKPSPEVKRAIRYYEAAPPKKQIVDFDSLTWKDVVPETNYQLEKLLVLIRRVRNNLFHGEKVGVLLEGNSQRDAKLLAYGLTILYACLQSSPEIRRKFFSEMDIETEEEDDELISA